MKKTFYASAATLVLALSSSTFLTSEAHAVCIGTCGSLGADGVVTAAPTGNGSYNYVSTNGGVEGAASLGLGNETTGSLNTVAISLAAGDVLQFYFNYVTSDGAGYADYAFAQLRSSVNADITLFTARTTPSGDTVPGFGMPPANPDVTFEPVTTPIIGGGPEWSPLGDSSADCWDEGCGYTGWVKMRYTVTMGGDYLLAFGVTNWDDNGYQSGLAYAGLAVNDVPVDATPIPGAAALMGTVLAAGAGFGAMRRRRRAERA